MSEPDEKIQNLVRDEIARAVANHGEHYASDHEAFAVLLEEVEEIKAWVWKKRRERDREAMVRELVQVAAVAQKWAASLLAGYDRETAEIERSEIVAALERERLHLVSVLREALEADRLADFDVLTPRIREEAAELIARSDRGDLTP